MLAEGALTGVGWQIVTMVIAAGLQGNVLLYGAGDDADLLTGGDENVLVVRVKGIH